jgi:hypothetical protein
MPLERPTVNLDAVAGVLDRVLAHPATEKLGALMPETVERVRFVRENLPAVCSGLEARGVEIVRAELVALELDVFGQLDKIIHGAMRAGKRRDRAAAKKPTKKKTKRLKR